MAHSVSAKQIFHAFIIGIACKKLRSVFFEIRALSGHAKPGQLRLTETRSDSTITRVIALDAGTVNAALDHLDGFGNSVRIFIKP